MKARCLDWRGMLIGTAALMVAAVPMRGAFAETAPDSSPEILTLPEAAQFLRVDRAVLFQLADWGQVPGRRIGTEWRFSRSGLLAWLSGETSIPAGQPARITAPSVRVAVSPAARVRDVTDAADAPRTPLDLRTSAQIAGRGASGAQTARKSAPQAVGTQGDTQPPIGEQPQAFTADEVFLRDQRVLLAPGETTLDFGLFYLRSDVQGLAAVNGGTTLATFELDAVDAALTVRRGVSRETEVFAATSIRYENQAAFVGSRELSDSSDTELDDISLGVRRTVVHEGVGRPDVVLSLSGHIPTGDSSYAIGGGVNLVKSFDPAILFSSIGYRHSFSREFSDISRLEAEDRIDATFGYAFALNDTLVLNAAVNGTVTSETDFDNARLRRQENFSLQFGMTSWLAPGLYIEPSVSFSLNGPANAFSFGINIPYTFGGP